MESNTCSSTKNRSFVADPLCEESNGTTTRTAATKSLFTKRPVWHGAAGICWALGPRPHDAHERETWWADSHARQRSLPSCDNWIGERAWFVVPSDHGVGIRCNHCRVDTARRDLVVDNIFQDQRQPDHQEHPSGRSARRAVE